jgi:hypothetical protein
MCQWIVDANGISGWWLNESTFIRHIEHAAYPCLLSSVWFLVSGL